MGPLPRLLVMGALLCVAACRDRVDDDAPPPPPTGIPTGAFQAKGPVVGPSRALGGGSTIRPWDSDPPVVEPPPITPTPIPTPPPPGPGADGMPL